MSGARLFIYGFMDTESPVQLGPVGIEQAEVFSEPYAGISALVSRTTCMDFEFLPREVLLHNLALYQAVIERIMEHYEVLPVKYGTFLQGEEELQAVLMTGYAEVTDQFRKMGRKVELDVVALWNDMEATLAEIGETEQIQSLKHRADECSPEDVAALRVKVGKAVKAILDTRSRERASEILKFLKPWAEASVTHPLMDDSMVMNVAFLLEKLNQQAFEDAVSQLDQRYEETMFFRLVGPLPPYSFCTLEILRPDMRRLLEAGGALGLGEEATMEEIREAYWRLAKEFHPDRFPGDKGVQKRFEDISRAYKILCEHCRNNRISFKENATAGWMQIRPIKRYERVG